MRQQSKEIASQIRERVRGEKERQLQAVNAIKQNELVNWQQRQMGKAKNDVNACLSKVGEAHSAAQAENAKAKLIEEQKVKNRKLALQRGKAAAQQLTVQKSRSPPSQKISVNVNIKDKPKKTLVAVSTQVNDSVDSSNISSSSSTSSLTSSTSTLVTQKQTNTGSSSRTLAEQLRSEYNLRSPQNSTGISYDEFDLETSDIPSAVSTKKSVQYDLQHSDTISDEDLDHLDDTYLHRNRIERAQIHSKPYSLKGSTSSDSLEISNQVPTITRVTDMLKKSRNHDALNKQDQFYLKSSLHKKEPSSITSSESLQKSPSKPIITNAKSNIKSEKPRSILKKPLPPPTSPKMPARPILKKETNKFQKTPKKTAVKQLSEIERRNQTPFHYVPRFTTNTQVDGETSEASSQRQKVQFYDHANRYSSEYDLEESVVVREDANTTPFNTNNAMDAARKEIEVEQRRLQELAEAR